MSGPRELNPSDYRQGMYEEGVSPDLAEGETQNTESFLFKIRKAVELRWRFLKADNFLNNPASDVEVYASIWDSLGEINSYPPTTRHTIESIFSFPDPRWQALLILGAGKNILRMLSNHWLQEGMDAGINDLEAPSKYNDYSSLYSNLQEEFNTRLSNLKATSEKHIMGIPGQTVFGGSLLTSYRSVGEVPTSRQGIRFLPRVTKFNLK